MFAYMAWHHPGKTLHEQFLQPRKLSQNRLALAIEVPPRRINEIVLGKRAITADSAVRLARYFNNEAAYWMKLQTDYDIALAVNNIGIHIYAIEQQEASHPQAAADEAKIFKTQLSANRNIKNNQSIKRRLLR